jgi:TolB protein
MKRYSNAIIIVLGALLIFCAATSEARVYLDVYGTSFKKITIGVPNFKGEKAEKLPVDMTDLLNKDLDISGFFITAPNSLIDKELLDEGIEKRDINFGSWRSMGIELVCKGKVEIKGGELALETSLYDTLDGSLLLAKRYKGAPGEWRRIVHRLADDILLAVTGEKGILSSRVLFVAGANNLKEVYTVDFDGQGLKKMTNYRSITLSPSLSPSGKYLAFTSFKDGRSNLYVVDVEKNTEVYVDRSDGMKIGSTWLNKSTIVYAHTSGRTSTIFSYDVEGHSKKTLLQKEGILTSPAMSPDGNRMLFVSDMYGSPQIFVRDNSSGEIKRLTYYGNYNSSPAFSPKGDIITFVSKLEGGFEICTMNADGTNQRVLTNDGTVNDSPQFSACGRYILYSSLRGGKYSAYIMLFNGDNKRPLKFTDYNEEQPRFAP